ncbi:hypothetical protein HG263_21755 [Pseudoalteromonas sp. JBTF-M23]|uniref:Uncharacterized protein n=1 Tax=Pseudoalteromonas caenipelagi TaxID=2726988 RepID=A0A849VJV9_9GAMM|nr:hypothetical protein [Pseudoalteromonas caenipelagi]NOU53130.1 hypothetical protein [Pseudoalteromonas caenipelagi]
MNISTHRWAHVYVEGNKLSVWVCPDSAGFDKSGNWDSDIMESNSLNLTAPATRAGWVELHAKLRHWFSPITVECGQ